MFKAYSFTEACELFNKRFTMEHAPVWAKMQCSNGKYPAPQFKSDREWYVNTTFPGEKYLDENEKHAISVNQSFPLGYWLDSPYKANRSPLGAVEDDLANVVQFVRKTA
jgi:hypothetical protein